MRIEAIGKPAGSKLLRISAELTDPPGEDSTLISISIRGDFFAVPEEMFEAVEKRLVGSKIADLENAFNASMEELRIQAIGISGQGILATVRKAIDEISIQNTPHRL